jgi:hypothetical protein
MMKKKRCVIMISVPNEGNIMECPGVYGPLKKNIIQRIHNLIFYLDILYWCIYIYIFLNLFKDGDELYLAI